jgi:NAD(P)-dependent dehydrogenase (short-subunit alcohol dehydrogenase family)
MLAREGAAVVLADLERAESQAADVVATIEAGGGTAHFLPVDVRVPDLVYGTVERAAELMGGIDAVVASAGVGSPPMPDGKSIRNLLDVPVEGFDFVMDINLRGVFLTCQRAAQLMIDAGHGGSMVTLASMASKRPTAGVYSISKAAVWMMTRCMAHELGQFGIRLNALGPGYIDTDLFRSMVPTDATPEEEDAFVDSRRSQTALRRLGSTDEVANAILFLLSDESSYFTGSILHPDGGFTSTFGGG